MSGGMKRALQDEMENGLLLMILKVADEEETAEKSLEDLAKIFAHEFSTQKDLILRVFGHCASEIPGKTRFYSTVVGLLNVSHPEIAEEIVKEAAYITQRSLKDGDFFKSKLMVRFLGELANANVLDSSDFLDLLNRLMDETKERNVPQERSDMFAYVVLSSLPWCAQILNSEKPEKFEQLFQDIDFYMIHRKKKNTDILSLFRGDSPVDSEEYMEYIWKNVKLLAETEWQLDLVPKTYQSLQTTMKAGKPLEFPSISIAPHLPETEYPSTFLTFRVFESLDNEAMKFSTMERVFVEDIVRDITYFFEVNHLECVKQLNSIPVTKGIPLDYVIVEYLLGKIFQLPEPEFKVVYYTTLIIDLCRSKNAQNIQSIIKKIVNVLYSHVDRMDVACFHRFAQWLSLHLSNFDFRWEWSEWSNAADASSFPFQHQFVREVLSRCISYSYYERIAKLIPEEMKSLLPPEATPNFKYLDRPISKELASSLKSRSIDSKIFLILNEGVGDHRLESNVEKISLFTETVLHFGLPSLSHLLVTVERSINIFREYNKTLEERTAIIEAVFSFWKHRPQYKVLITEKLLAMRIIDAASVISYLFAEVVIPEANSASVWELLFKVMNQLIAKTRTAESEVEEEERVLRQIKEKGGDVVSMDRQRERLNKVKPALTRATVTEREAFQTIFASFVETLDQKLRSSDPTYTWVIGYLRAFGREFAWRLRPDWPTISAAAFSEASSRVQVAAQEIQSLFPQK